MDGIFFLILALFTIILSIKLSYYGDVLSKQSKIGAAFIGGLLIASITSLPELVTCTSAIYFNNITLAFGDIVGSNIFNIFVLAVYNLYFFKSNFFKNASKKYMFECVILIIDYLFIYLSCIKLVHGFTSFIIFLLYVLYLISIFKSNDLEEPTEDIKNDKFIGVKFIITAILMVFFSIALTHHADEISHLYPKFSSSSIGAILLGISTSLPEVVTTFALIKLKSYNMAISNMLGSNIFNFLVLAVSDLFIKNNHIYNYTDKYGMIYVYGGFILTFLFFSCISKIFHKKVYYVFTSILMVTTYLIVWYLQFV